MHPVQLESVATHMTVAQMNRERNRGGCISCKKCHGLCKPQASRKQADYDQLVNTGNPSRSRSAGGRLCCCGRAGFPRQPRAALAQRPRQLAPGAPRLHMRRIGSRHRTVESELPAMGIDPAPDG
jgi:hypothetical protein